MPFRKWSNAQKAEAIALATSIGADLAAEQLGMTADAIRDWAKRANVELADVIAAPDWARLMNLALARTEALVASGNLKPAQVATVAAIAKRNMDKPKPDEERTADDDLIALIDERYPDPEQRRLAHEATGWAIREFIRRDDSDPGPDANEPDRAAGEAVNRWLLGILEGTTDLEAYVAAARDRDARDRVRRTVIGRRAAVLATSGMTYHEALTFAAEQLTDDYPDPYEATP